MREIEIEILQLSYETMRKVFDCRWSASVCEIRECLRMEETYLWYRAGIVFFIISDEVNDWMIYKLVQIEGLNNAGQQKSELFQYFKIVSTQNNHDAADDLKLFRVIKSLVHCCALLRF